MKELRIWNFRKYGVKDVENNTPGIVVHFHPTFNLLIGENDSGKTAILDAIKLTLGTTSDDNLWIKEEDFYVSKDKEMASEIKIGCILSGLTKQEAGIFLEWLSFDNDGGYELQVRLIAKRQAAEAGVAERIDKSIKAGPELSSTRLEGIAREVLRTTYLKPLRNAKIELQPGIRSRLAQILRSHPAFYSKDPLTKHELEMAFEEANKQVNSFFAKTNDEADTKTIQSQLEHYLQQFFNTPTGDELEQKSKFKIAPVKLNEILRKLSLLLEDVPSGLGSLNLLFIAAELLLHDDDLAHGPHLTLIEEIEAHLHPQAQLRLIKYLQEKAKEVPGKSGNQFILSTHSTTLAASTKLEHIILLYDGVAYPMKPEFTALSKGDYQFLERFLDATKSNLFFAKGVIFVEGDAENLLLPMVAELLGRPLHKYGVSIVNIGNIAFKRYVKIYSRSEKWIASFPGATLMMPISIVTDLDVRPMEYYEEKKKKKDEQKGEGENAEAESTDEENGSEEKKGEMQTRNIYMITDEAVSDVAVLLGVEVEEISHLLNQAFATKDQFSEEIIKYPKAKVKQATIKEIFKKVTKQLSAETIESLRASKASSLSSDFESLQGNIKLCYAQKWTLEYEIALSGLRKMLAEAICSIQFQSMDIDARADKLAEYKAAIDGMAPEAAAYEIYKPLLNKNVSKATTAQYLAWVLQENKAEASKILLKDEHLQYLRDAIYHVTGGDPTDAD
ncbi:ATP-dependent nuclease [Paenibacillus sp. NRS-1783]|uniref:ATP-dependent nuclease n=1 Tax=Paenibacillus sp. NRS-1783 TaxID=3233907 RepID=UPI003D294E0B